MPIGTGFGGGVRRLVGVLAELLSKLKLDRAAVEVYKKAVFEYWITIGVFDRIEKELQTQVIDKRS